MGLNHQHSGEVRDEDGRQITLIANRGSPWVRKDSCLNATKLATIFVFLAFLAAAASYMGKGEELSEAIMVIPVGLLVVASGLILLSRTCRPMVGRHLCRMDTIVVFWFIPIAGTISDAGVASQSTLQIAILALVMVSFAILAPVLKDRIMTAYGWACTITTGLFVFVYFHEVLDALQTADRFVTPAAHPNLIGFVFAGSFFGHLWLIISSRGILRCILTFSSLLSLLIVIATGSRGSAVGLGCGFGFVALFASLDFVRSVRSVASKAGIVMGVLLIVLIGAIAIPVTDAGRSAEAWVSSHFALENQGRGLDSGMSGRGEIWTDIQRRLEDRGIWTGIGYRRSGELVGSIDNGYLVVLFEMGAVPFLALFGILLWRGAQLLRIAQLDCLERWRAMLLLGLLINFMLNNIVARYLLGVGNPLSLWGVWILFWRPPSVKRTSARATTVDAHRSRSIVIHCR